MMKMVSAEEQWRENFTYKGKAHVTGGDVQELTYKKREKFSKIWVKNEH